MHEVYDVEIPGIVWAIALVVAVSILIYKYTKAADAHRLEILKLQKLAADEIARAEQEEAEEFLSMRLRRGGSVAQIQSSPRLVINQFPATSEIVEPLQTASQDSPIVKQASPLDSRTLASLGLCAVCSTPTKKQCSRCKAVKYCSRECQVAHWSDGHKQDCQESKRQPVTNVVQLGVASSSESSKTLVTKDDNSNESGLLEEETRAERQPAASSKSFRVVETYSSNGSLPNPSKVLFPYDYFVELFCWTDLELVPCGLVNCGNSCFANVVLQCLTFTQPLAAYLLKGCHKEECRRKDWCFMCELQDLLYRIRKSQGPFSPLCIVSKIRNIGNQMDYGRQEDAHEFMRVAIDSMQSICLDNMGGEKAVDQRTQETTLIYHIYGGHLQSQVRCMQCHRESYKYETMLDLAVEIQGHVETLEDALEQFTTPEWLDGENKYKCDSCNAYVIAWKRLVVHEAPNILTIALKRFQSGKFGKLNKRVSFPEVLDISPYMSDEGDKPPLYHLYGVIVHIDMLNASFFGHYICYIKDFQGSWFKIDDSKVKEVDIEKVMEQRVYMLLYARSAARKAPIVTPRGTQLSGGSVTNLYDYSDYEGDLNNRRFTSRYVFTMAGGAVSWRSRLQTCVTQSTTEAEYVVASEAIWLGRLVTDLEIKEETPMLHYDSQSAIQLAHNPVYHSKTKHVDVKYHFIRGMVEDKQIQLVTVLTIDNPADLLTKGLPGESFAHCHKLLTVG
ncbi:hypothetical protein L7F22_004072 [Adiantum nelumboides]|nr:hypothetical protein [Adiantum nelumboides]